MYDDEVEKLKIKLYSVKLADRALEKKYKVCSKNFYPRRRPFRLISREDLIGLIAKV
jgi:hypothetical protein